MADYYETWRKRLKGEDAPLPDTNFGVVAGFWRTPKGEALATWISKSGAMLYKMNDAPAREVTEDWALRVWSVTAGNRGRAITEQQYRHFLSTREWFDAPPKTHNNPPEETPVETGTAETNPLMRLRRILEVESENVMEWLRPGAAEVVKTQEAADRAANWADKVSKIEKEVEAAFRAEKDPIVKRGREIDDAWRPLRDLAETLKKTLKNACVPYLSFVADQQRKLDDERARAARANEAPPSDPLPETSRRESVNVGSSGRKVSLTKRWFARVVDYDKAIIALKTHPEMKQKVEELAHRAAQKQIPVDGVEFYQEDAAR